ncbi:TPA: hypothetical protein L4741_004748 [Pseudomonas aeruginosa]|nr:hypothetical protein [Pseudomonas aeruginosa]
MTHLADLYYRGTTSSTTQLRPSIRGSFGSGLYFADKACATQYAGPGGSVWEVQLSWQNPFRCTAAIENDYDLDNPAVPLVLTIFPKAEAEALIRKAAETDGHFGPEIQERLRDLGHDGIFATYEDGSFEVVVFRADQVNLLRRLDSTAV